MSGGHFNGAQFYLRDIADSIDTVIFEWEKSGILEGFSEPTIAEFRAAVELLRRAEVYAQRIDYLISGDDSEATFHTRLRKELEDLDQ